MILSNDEIKTMRGAALRGGARLFWDMAHEICQEYGIAVADLKAKGRGSKEALEARQFLCLFAIRRGLSTSLIGRLLGRDHTTIMHAARQAEKIEKMPAYSVDECP